MAVRGQLVEERDRVGVLQLLLGRRLERRRAVRVGRRGGRRRPGPRTGCARTGPRPRRRGAACRPATAGPSAFAGRSGSSVQGRRTSFGLEVADRLVPGVVGEPEQVVLVPVGERRRRRARRGCARRSAWRRRSSGPWRGPRAPTWSSRSRSSRCRSARPSGSGASYSSEIRKQSPKPTWYIRIRTRTTCAHHASPELSSVLCSSANACPRAAPSEKPRRLLGVAAAGAVEVLHAAQLATPVVEVLVDVQLEPSELVEDQGAAAEELDRRRRGPGSSGIASSAISSSSSAREVEHLHVGGDGLGHDQAVRARSAGWDGRTRRRCSTWWRRRAGARSATGTGRPRRDRCAAPRS